MRWGRGLGADGATGDPRRRSAPARSGRRRRALGGSALVLAVLMPAVRADPVARASSASARAAARAATIDRRQPDRPTCVATCSAGRTGRSSGSRPTTPTRPTSGSPSLTVFTDNEWSTGDREHPAGEPCGRRRSRTDEIDPAVERVALRVRRGRGAGLRVRLAPARPTRVDQVTAGGRLALRRRDPRLPGRPTTTSSTAGLTYSFTEVELDLEAEAAGRRGRRRTGEVDRDYIELPDDFPAMRRATSRRRSPATTRPDYEKAVALQDWFREDGGFSTTSSGPTPATASTSSTAFLPEGDGGRVGYCEQFAVRHGRDGPVRWASPPGWRSGSSPRPQRGDGELGVLHERLPRLAGAVLRRRRLGPVRADAGQPGGGEVPSYTQGELPIGPTETSDRHRPTRRGQPRPTRSARAEPRPGRPRT